MAFRRLFGGRRREPVADISATRVFGVDIDQVMLRQEETGQIPLFLELVFKYIEGNPRHINLEGIFRVAGTKVVVEAVQRAFDRGDSHLREISDFQGLLTSEDLLTSKERKICRDRLPFTTLLFSLASLLKLYFRNHPSSFLDPNLAESLFEISGEPDRLRFLQTQLQTQLSVVRRATLRRLFRLLSRVGANSARNGMTPQNLSLVWSSALLRPANSRANEMVLFMIEHESQLFGSAPAPAPARVVSPHEMMMIQQQQYHNPKQPSAPSLDRPLQHGLLQPVISEARALQEQLCAGGDEKIASAPSAPTLPVVSASSSSDSRLELFLNMLHYLPAFVEGEVQYDDLPLLLEDEQLAAECVTKRGPRLRLLKAVSNRFRMEAAPEYF